MNIYLRLFFEFFKTGLFAVGGGLATLPFLSDLAEKTGWFTQADLANMVAISESTPGAIGVNMATYVGFETVGVIGSIVATLGLVCPSIIIIVIIFQFLKRFQQSKAVQDAFYGLRPASTGLIAAAGIGVAEISLMNIGKFQVSGQFLDLFFWKGILLAAVLYFLIKKTKKHPVVYIALSAAIGVIFHFSA